MASTTLYPPIVNNTAAAFVASGESAYCRLYFSLSKYSSSIEQIKSIHISVVKQSNGHSVVRKVDGDGRYRATGIIILNISPQKVENQDNLYYVDILNEDIQSGDNEGWCAGWIYKIQIRLSTVTYDGTIGQSAWLNANASNFSEWSTYCTTKAINKPTIKIPVMKNFNSDVDLNNSNKEKNYSLSSSTLDFSGSYSNEDKSETLYSYEVKLLDTDENIIEESGVQYTNQYYTPNQFRYLFRHELQDSYSYIVRFSYTTVNKYEESFDFNIVINLASTLETVIKPISIEDIDMVENPEFIEKFNKSTSLVTEQEEGRIGIKLYSNDDRPFNGNVCLRRSDSSDNFSTWTDIKIIVCINDVINDLDTIFDYTVESGVWYRYGIQLIETNGYRGLMNVQRSKVIREWEHSFLVGEGGRQLKLKYDNNMSSYVYNYLESKTDTIGGQYPFITRNGNTKYRTIPVNGLISFNMDDNELFTNDKDLYKYTDVVNDYKNRRKKEHIEYYDYKREHDFREKVLAFLQDGKPKLFKSSTEGNLIVRLMEVTSQPNQSLNRMIYSFTSNGHEIAEATMENYLKYGFFEVGEWSRSFDFYTTKIGQLNLDFNVGDNIIEKIWQKYDHSNQNIAGLRQTLNHIHHLTLEFTDRPLKVTNNAGEVVMGNSVKYKNRIITINSNYGRFYSFDENINFVKGEDLIVLGDSDGEIQTVHITVDFLYEVKEEPYIEKEIDTYTTIKGVGQVYDTYDPGDNIYRDIYYKYYSEWELEFRRLSRVSWTCLEAAVGAVFMIQDGADNPLDPPTTRYHEINWTGVLNLEELGTIKDIKYIGMRKPDGTIDKTKRLDIIIDYIYYVTEGTYREGEG